MKDLVSIITPMYNSQDFIVQSIESVIKQTYIHWELILVDDGSLDETVNLVSLYEDKDPRIHCYVLPTNQGAAKARNYGTKMAKGKYIAFLDADDLWLPQKLQFQLQVLKKTDVCFSSYKLISQQGTALSKTVTALPLLNYKKLLKANYIGNLTGIYNCSVLGKIYTKDLKKRQDWLLWLEALRRSNKPAIGIKKSLALYRTTSNSLSSNKWGLLKHNFMAYHKGLGFSKIKSFIYMFIFLYEYLLVKRRLITKH